jgi:hypothetical protein
VRSSVSTDACCGELEQTTELLLVSRCPASCSWASIPCQELEGSKCASLGSSHVSCSYAARAPLLQAKLYMLMLLKQQSFMTAKPPLNRQQQRQQQKQQ